MCRWLGVEVAVKELHATNSVQSNAEMFGEAETLNSLRHPCIIAFYGVVVNQARTTTAFHGVVDTHNCNAFSTLHLCKL